MSEEFITVTSRSRTRRKPTINLHGLARKAAIIEVRRFLDHQTKRLEEEGISSRKIRIITGRGLHSRNGYALLREETLRILKERGLNCYSDNKGGRLNIQLYRKPTLEKNMSDGTLDI